ncbi:hypothetical protein BDY24DRAFT_222043 [Mrakia frigida]|uniref:uncharacterized protein n=1 Tax=Mrakia frigida TaxID=29902 RepID=UPI003FCC0842
MTILLWVLDHVVDPNTLAALTRVSRSCLRVVGPFLYTNVSLLTFKQWQSVFFFETPPSLRPYLGRDLVFTATLAVTSTEFESVARDSLAGGFFPSGTLSSSSLARITIVLPLLAPNLDLSTYHSLKGTSLSIFMSSVLSLASLHSANASEEDPGSCSLRNRTTTRSQSRERRSWFGSLRKRGTSLKMLEVVGRCARLYEEWCRRSCVPSTYERSAVD